MPCLRGKPDRRDVSRQSHVVERASSFHRFLIHPVQVCVCTLAAIFAAHTFPANNSDNDTPRSSLAAVEISIREAIGVGNAAAMSRLHYRNYRFSLVPRQARSRWRGEAFRNIFGDYWRGERGSRCNARDWELSLSPLLSFSLSLSLSLCLRYYNYIILFIPRSQSAIQYGALRDIINCMHIIS
jgi:hypothetical protein